jgi:hypothetical protein
LKRCLIEDAEFVRRIITHPDVYPGVTDDGSGPAEKWNRAGEILSNPDIYALSPNPNALFLYLPINSATTEVHTCILPDGRGREGVRAAKESIRWIFTQTDFRKIISWVPSFNRAALVFARMAGLSREGINRMSFLKDGTLFDQHLLGITKEEWTCL